MNRIKEQDKNIIKSNYGLEYYKSNDFEGFEGNLTIYNTDVYHISINLKRPIFLLPIVKELDGRIPRKPDRHVYIDGTCCLTTEAKGNFLLKTEIKTIVNFIDFIVIPFFKNNSFFEINKKYVNSEYKHGIHGIIEFYTETANINDISLLIFFLDKILTNKKEKRNELCFCGSGKKFKKCHLKSFDDISLVNKNILKKDIENIKKSCDLIRLSSL